MKYIKLYENFTPITINNAKPFRVKNGLNKSMMVLRDSISSLRRRLQEEKSLAKRSKMNRDINKKVQKLAELNFKNLKQIEYFANNPVKESLDEEEETDNLDVILKSPDFKPEDILDYMGMDEEDYEIEKESEFDYFLRKYITKPKYDKDGITFNIKLNYLENILDIETGILDYILRIARSHDGYSDYYVDDSEMEYLQNYLPKNVVHDIEKLAKTFNYDINLDDSDEEHLGQIVEFFNDIGLNSDIQDFKNEISYENERAIEKAARKLLEELPIDVDRNWTGKFDLEISLSYDTIIEHIKQNKLEVKTIKEFIQNMNHDLSYDFEYDMKQEFLGDFKDLVREVENVVDKYLSSPDDIFPKIIECDNLEFFKKNIDLAVFNYWYDTWISGNRKQLTLFEIAKLNNKSILEWFKSYDFQKYIISESEAEIYKLLLVVEIINPKIKEDYEYLLDSDKYNI